MPLVLLWIAGSVLAAVFVASNKGRPGPIRFFIGQLKEAVSQEITTQEGFNLVLRRRRAIRLTPNEIEPDPEPEPGVTGQDTAPVPPSCRPRTLAT
jgi:hypothetical protein